MTSERIIYNDMVGHVFSEVHVIANDGKSDRIIFVRNDGYRIVFIHVDECCEHVTIEDINGDCKNLIGKPLRVAEMYTTDVPNSLCCDDEDLYTFYRFATEDEFVTVRWHGSSNGYYSVCVEKYELFNGVVTSEDWNYPRLANWVFQLRTEEQ